MCFYKRREAQRAYEEERDFCLDLPAFHDWICVRSEKDLDEIMNSCQENVALRTRFKLKTIWHSQQCKLYSYLILCWDVLKNIKIC